MAKSNRSRELLEPAAISPLERQLLVAGDAGRQQSKPSIQAVGASALLGRLKDFLPQMQQANADLEHKLQTCDPKDLDIEHIDEEQDAGDAPVIQMDLACGLLELRDAAALGAAQRAIAAGGEVAVEAYDGASGSSSSSEEEQSDECDEDDASDEDDGDGAGGDRDGARGGSRGSVSVGVGSSDRKAGGGGGDVAPPPDTHMADAGAPGPAGVAAAAAGRPSAGPAAGSSSGQAAAAGVQQQQQQQQAGRRRKLRAKKPMIEEL